jgi:hypothetical protein
MATIRDWEDAVRILSVLVILWLLIGIAAAAQRDYFDDSEANCAELGTIVVTVISGPLNYVGANPKVDCQLPQPSK